jgi:hypothetical protein
VIVVFDASAFISAALKVDSIPERALVRALIEPDKLILSRAVEDEYAPRSAYRSGKRTVPSRVQPRMMSSCTS